MDDWPVVPLCSKQLLDVNSRDILEGGLYRKCNVYKGGGGYDQFPAIYKKRFGRAEDPVQFVVQLKGCPLKCPYCYVTRQGVWGDAIEVSTLSMLQAYDRTGLDIFHLMGGAPAIYLHRWKELASKVKVFHSDLLLVESLYRSKDLKDLPGLHAVSFKERHIYPSAWIPNIWRNLEKLIENRVNFYITFTGSDEFSSEIIERFGPEVLEDSFIIPVKQYKALD